MSLDDNHNSIVLACAKAIQSALSFDMNEIIFDISEESVGDDEVEGDHTIQDDIFVAGLDIVACLVRMGILPRICYLLETDPAAPLEECLNSILIAIARHSPTCAAANYGLRKTCSDYCQQICLE
ncbi:hypothetical protein BUALT_Bualt13G0124700 [Buddleja alternifolia]|uniref:Uncharacterized protein n=1 Tax=Buddleja alternifolia TaxID=168488 RepID=A0AAV6WM73_9LAMI|nr:hypothetical protein BUALT_Bualt13G0124700 [Buddleja alternifolia]